MKPSDYNMTKKEDTIAGSVGIGIFVFGTQGEFRALGYQTIEKERKYSRWRTKIVKLDNKRKPNSFENIKIQEDLKQNKKITSHKYERQN